MRISEPYEPILAARPTPSLRADLARAEAERDAAIAIGEAKAAALRELANRLTAELLDARVELAELRWPWWRRCGT